MTLAQGTAEEVERSLDLARANKAIVTRFFETFSSGDATALLNAMSDDCTWWVSGRLEGMSGRYDKASFAKLIEGAKIFYKTGRLVIEPRSMIAEGDAVAVEAEGTAELVDGRMFLPHYHFVVVVSDGQIKEVREYMDTQHAKDIFFAS